MVVVVVNSVVELEINETGEISAMGSGGGKSILGEGVEEWG